MFEVADLVHFNFSRCLNRQRPSGFMDCLDFQTVTAMIEATASLRHLRLALSSTVSLRTLSESLVLVIVRAVDFMAILISSVIPMVPKYLSSSLSQTGIVRGHAAKILPINRPFAKVASKCGGIEKLSL